jgi:protein-tyrosine phosphatase
MIDVHCHLLHSLDDGPNTLEESLAMVRIAAESGTTDLVATPHASPEFPYQAELVAERISELAAACGSSLRIYPGCDFHLTYENIQDALSNPSKYSINHLSYLLVEFSDLLVHHNAGAIFERLRSVGLLPVITHPERNRLLKERLNDLEAWVKDGCFLQITAQSLLGDFGLPAQDFSEVLLKRGLVHFVASDGHNCDARPPRLDEAYGYLAAAFGRPTAELLCVANPRAALAGEPLAYLQTSRKWYRFWT